MKAARSAEGGFASGPTTKYPIRETFSGFCASPASGVARRQTTTRMLPPITAITAGRSITSSPDPLVPRRRECEAESEHDLEPDPPHAHLGWGWLAGV